MNFKNKFLSNHFKTFNQVLCFNTLRRKRKTFVLTKMPKYNFNKNQTNLTVLKEKVTKTKNELDDQNDIIIIEDESDFNDVTILVKDNGVTKDSVEEAIKTSTLFIKPKKLIPENYRIKEIIEKKNLVFFDLETGGLANVDDILQIGAINSEGKTFNLYVTPTRKISKTASSVHHITYVEGQMYYRKNKVSSYCLEEALFKFYDYLNATSQEKVVLVAHNAVFDRRFLINKLFRHGLIEKFEKKILGFIDTIPMFKNILPGKSSYKQENLVKICFPNLDYDSHNAIADVIYLQKLYNKLSKPVLNKYIKFHNNFSTTFEYGLLKKSKVFTIELKTTETKTQEKIQRIVKRKENRKRSSAAIYENGEPILISNTVSLRRSNRKK